MVGLTEKVKEFVKNRGATLVGIASPERLSNAPEEHRPEDFLPNVKSLISIALKINRSSILQLPKTRREYTLNYEVANLKLNSLAWETACFLEGEGYEAIPISARGSDIKKFFGDISHKHVAVAAGLGRFGLSNLVLTPTYGSYVRFVTVLTNAPLKPDEPLNDDTCLREECLKCVEACPVGALEKSAYNPVEGWRMSKEKCHHYMNVILDGEVCGLCIKACHSKITEMSIVDCEKI